MSNGEPCKDLMVDGERCRVTFWHGLGDAVALSVMCYRTLAVDSVTVPRVFFERQNGSYSSGADNATSVKWVDRRRAKHVPRKSQEDH